MGLLNKREIDWNLESGVWRDCLGCRRIFFGFLFRRLRLRLFFVLGRLIGLADRLRFLLSDLCRLGLGCGL